MKRGLLLLLILPATLFAWGSQSLDDWIKPADGAFISTDRLLQDGTYGSSIYIPVSTGPFYYEVPEEGEGSVEFWIYDPGNCLDNPNPGYPNGGPMWGMQTSGYAAVCVGIGRAGYVAGCQGYSPWSTVAPYSYTWFKDGTRASHSHAFTPGWYKWIIAGGWDDITFEAPEMSYEGDCYPPYDDDCCDDYGITITYDATYQGGAWEAVFGDGWNAFYLRGDGAGGIEDISVDIVSGTGVFAGIDRTSSARGYQAAGWHEIKGLFR